MRRPTNGTWCSSMAAGHEAPQLGAARTTQVRQRPPGSSSLGCMAFRMDLWIMNALGSEVLFLLRLEGRASQGGQWFCSCLPEALSQLLHV